MGNTVTITLGLSELSIVFQQARLSDLGGRSNVHSGEDRRSRCFEDQISGHACHLAASLILFRSAYPYLRQRDRVNQDPYRGDGGADFEGTVIDVKGGMMRSSLRPLKHHLVVPKSEYHDGFVYVSCLTDSFVPSVLECYPQLNVHLFGWAHASMLHRMEDKNYMNGIFYGKYVLRNDRLNDLPLPMLDEFSELEHHLEGMYPKYCGDPK